MLKLRALNESSSSSESEDEDGPPRLSDEAQEAQARSLYEKAQHLTIKREDIKALAIFEQILELPYLNECESKPLSPVQLQIRLGCLKCLSTLYRSGSTKNIEESIKVLEMITAMEPNNVNFWYRLGKVALENKDLDLAFDAFSSALDCSPGHWGSIENLVTIAYATHDLLGCLRFCSMGLSKDAEFIKGYVFRDHIFKSNSWVQKSLLNKAGFEGIFANESKIYSDEFRTKYLSEAQLLLRETADKKALLRRLATEESNVPIKCPYDSQSLSYVKLGKLVVEFYQYLKDNGVVLNPVIFEEMEETIEATVTNLEVTETICLEIPADCVIEEPSCTSSQIRSRASSDDKETPQCGGTENGNGEVDFEDKNTDEMDSQSMLNSQEEEGCQRKKSRKDVKWWQKEGQRRSQRVRGNLISAPTKPKPESTFAETLRNIIPTALLTTDTKLNKDKEHLKSSQKQTEDNKPLKESYFGSKQEVSDAKQFLGEWGKTNIMTIIRQLVYFMSRNCKGQWSQELRSVYLQLFHLYQCTTPITHVLGETPEVPNNIENDLFAFLTKAELSFDATLIADPQSLALIENLKTNDVSDMNFFLRYYWLQAKSYLQMCKDDEIDYSFAECYLNLILEVLKSKPEQYACFCPTQTDFLISQVNITEKVSFVKKMENLYKIEELYEEKRYEELVDILQFSLSADASQDDVNNRMCLSESYFKLGKMECINECEKICEMGVRTSSEEIIVQCLTLLESIWDGLKPVMTVDEFKIIINILIKILIMNEKQQEPTNESLITKPWCFLHGVLFYLERKESAFFIEDDNVPNSVLTLQLGHEILSKVNKCCANDGHLLKYVVSSLLNLQHADEYWTYDETKTCLEQAIFCLYSHPSKKFKLKNLKDHGSPGIPLDWAGCCQLYEYFKLDELPEFDSRSNKSIVAEVENLFQRIVETIPDKLKPVEQYNKMKSFVEGKLAMQPIEPTGPELDASLKLPTFEIFYLLADYYLKTQELNKAVDYYIWDLAVCPVRFDTWTAVALSKAEDIFGTLNSCDGFRVEEVMSDAEAVNRCFRAALNLDPANSKIRIEFGSFLYALHSVYSRELKFHTDKFSIETFEEIERKKSEYLLEAQYWFEPSKTNNPVDVDDSNSHNEEVWINHYMLGKIAEKVSPADPAKYLTQYELAGKLLHDQGAPYPNKISYISPLDYALEALEVYYRIHASILSYAERVSDYNKEVEEIMLQFLRKAEESPFIKNKQGRGTEGGDSKKKKGADEVSKKDMLEINKLMNEMLEKVEILAVEKQKPGSEDSSSTPSSTSTSDSSSSSSEDSKDKPNKLPRMTSMSLSAFLEMDKQESKLLEEKEKCEKSKVEKSTPLENITPASSSELKPEKSESENNPFYQDFSERPYGLVISLCLKGMKECVSRYPQCFKAYYRLTNSYVLSKKYKKAREFLLGNTQAGKSKIVGLYGERKPSNFFYGIWRNPVDDIERPGSFPFHMAKSMQLLLKSLRELNDHQLLADVGIQLSKVPDSKNAYLYTEDREQFSKEAIKSCSTAAKKFLRDKRIDIIERGNLIYDTYIKFNKHNPKENVVAPVLHEAYTSYIVQMSAAPIDPTSLSGVTHADAVRFYQHLAWTSKNGTQPKAAAAGPIDGFKKKFMDRSNSSNNAQKHGQSFSGQLPVPTLQTAKKQTPQRRLSDQSKGDSRNFTNSSQMQFPNLLNNQLLPALTMEEIERRFCISQMSQNSTLYAAYAAHFTALAEANQQLQLLRNLDKIPIPTTKSSNSFDRTKSTSAMDYTHFQPNLLTVTNYSNNSSQKETDKHLSSKLSSGKISTNPPLVFNNDLQISRVENTQKPRKEVSAAASTPVATDVLNKRENILSKNPPPAHTRPMPPLKIAKPLPVLSPREPEISKKNFKPTPVAPSSNKDKPSLNASRTSGPQSLVSQLIANVSKAMTTSKNQNSPLTKTRIPEASHSEPQYCSPQAQSKNQNNQNQNLVETPPPALQPYTPPSGSKPKQVSTPTGNSNTMPSLVPAFRPHPKKKIFPKSVLVGSTEITSVPVPYDQQNPNLNLNSSSGNNVTVKQSHPPNKPMIGNFPGKTRVKKPPVSRKSDPVGGFVRGQNNPYPNADSRPYMTSSPFQAQQTAMANPALSKQKSQTQMLPLRTPQPAHSQPIINPRFQSQSEEPEVVDLTTKSPEKLAQESQPKPKPAAGTNEQNSPEKILGLSAWDGSSSDSSYKNTAAEKLYNRSASFMENVLSRPQLQRPAKRPLPPAERQSPYPLPPKKKHHIMMAPPPPDPDNDSDIEVITLE